MEPLMQTSPSAIQPRKKVTFCKEQEANEEELPPPPKLEFNRSSSKTSLKSFRGDSKKEISMEQFQKGKFLGKGIYGEVIQVT